jgi:tRNA C32,U32 (ribose-2'-O)-methylase TrmJ
MESIKISQSKSESASILHCLVWLKQITAALGNKDQEVKILSHIIKDATKKVSQKSKKNNYCDDVFVLINGLLNYLLTLTVQNFA